MTEYSRLILIQSCVFLSIAIQYSAGNITTALCSWIQLNSDHQIIIISVWHLQVASYDHTKLWLLLKKSKNSAG